MTQPSSTFRFVAHNTAAESENKIHDDRAAAAYGFRRGLVPGVTVCGYMIPAVLERFGAGWLEGGGMTVRFLAPCYEGETVIVRCAGSLASAEREDGSVCASGVVTMADSTPPPAAVGEKSTPTASPGPLPENRRGTGHDTPADLETLRKLDV